MDRFFKTKPFNKSFLKFKNNKEWSEEKIFNFFNTEEEIHNIKSPAKINLFLDIKDKREDGYHNLETVFEKISLFDDIYVHINTESRRKDIKLESEGFSIPKGEENLVCRILELLLNYTKMEKGLKIFIYKRIPPGMGLGGGSSNAATVLRWFINLFRLKLNKEEIIYIGKKIGADVPFFLEKYTFGYATERGDLVREIKSDLNMWHVLILPNKNISTKKAYQIFDKNSGYLTNEKYNVKLLIRSLEDGNIKGVTENLFNSFEPLLSQKFDFLEKSKNILNSCGAGASLLTGSGSATYGIFFSKEEALIAKKKLEESYDFDIRGPIQTFREE